MVMAGESVSAASSNDWRTALTEFLKALTELTKLGTQALKDEIEDRKKGEVLPRK